MTNLNMKPGEMMAVVATIDPQSLSATAHSSDWFDTSRFHRFVAVLSVGAIGASASVAMKFQQATTSGGAAADVTGLAITTLVKATDDNKQALLELRPINLDVANGYRWAKVVVTVAEAASLGSVVVLGIGPRTGMAHEHDLASVAQIKAI